MKKFKISEIKEQGIWVKCSLEDAQKLHRAVGMEFKYSPFFYSKPFRRFFKNTYEFQNETPSSYIEFSQIDWEERKQIGWKLKKDYEHLFTAADNICEQSLCKDRAMVTTLESFNANRLSKAGVLELWFEPVYEEVKYMANDKIVIVSFGTACSYRFKVDKVYELSKEFNATNGLHVIKDDLGSANGFIGAFDMGITIRHATAEEKKQYEQEIKAAEKIEIGGYSVDFELCHSVKTGDYYITKISGYEFTKEFWEAALIVSKHQKAKIKIGCSHQFDLPTETIERILSKLK